MADTKITALTALTAADPANDVIPIVDVSDTSMAASGTTKKISVNNIIGAGGVASFSSSTVSGTLTAGAATITGAATVGTTLGVTGASTLASVGVTGAATVGTTLLVGTNATLTNGNVIIGTSGKGIDFSATANSAGTMTSELLADYEEGTFTPGVTFGGASVGMIGSFSGKYTKVGRIVTVNGIINITTRGTSTGTALITGLPFTSSNTASEYTSVSLRLASISFTNAFQGFVQFNSTSINLEQITNAGTESVLTHSNFSVGTSFLIWNCTYTAA